MKARTGHFRLRREIGLFEATFYGVGIILGAGIYVLIGEGAALAGNALWLAFGVAALLALFTAFSYAELSSMFPREAAEYTYTYKAFRRRQLAFVVQWVLIITGMITAATVALGFGGYLTALLGAGSPIIAAAALIAGSSAINWYGLKESARFNIFSTLMEMAGLVVVIATGMSRLGSFSADLTELPSAGFAGVLSAAALIYFAYIGFENVANISEEAKMARKIVPKAIVFSLAISSTLYMLVSVFAVGAAGWQALAASKAPLADVAASTIPQAGFLLSIFALFATANTVLIILITTSRMVYGMGCQQALPGICSAVGKRGTPYIAVGLAMLGALGFVLVGNIGTVAKLADLGIFFAYLAVNAALVKLRFTMPGKKRLFRSPLNLGKLPVLALLGVATTAILLVHIDPVLWLYESALVAAGILLYTFLAKQKK